MIAIFREVRDPREVNARHELADILFVSPAATLCGAKSCVEIAEFIDGRLEDLREIVPLRRGAPSHDTFSRVFRLLDPDELARAFTAFMSELRRALGLAPPKGVVAVDGRTATAVRYVALSKKISPRRLAAVARAHWTIENRLHWTLDVVSDEDDASTRKDNGPQNLAVIRRLARNILQARPLNKPIASKMRRANWNKQLFFELFAHMR